MKTSKPALSDKAIETIETNKTVRSRNRWHYSAQIAQVVFPSGSVVVTVTLLEQTAVMIVLAALLTVALAFLAWRQSVNRAQKQKQRLRIQELEAENEQLRLGIEMESRSHPRRGLAE